MFIRNWASQQSEVTQQQMMIYEKYSSFCEVLTHTHTHTHTERETFCILAQLDDTISEKIFELLGAN